jgi:RNA polymerase primary sigma factor
MSPKEFRIDFKIRNNLILSLMEREGIKTIRELSELSGVSYQTVWGFIAMAIPARLSDDSDWKETIYKISRVLKCLPEEMFSESQRRGSLKKNSAFITADSHEIHAVTHSLRVSAMSPELLFENKKKKEMLSNMLSALNYRERAIVEKIYGLDDGEEKTLKQIGDEFGVGPSRVRQIGIKAVSKLRGMAYRAKLKESDLKENTP